MSPQEVTKALEYELTPGWVSSVNADKVVSLIGIAWKKGVDAPTIAAAIRVAQGKGVKESTIAAAEQKLAQLQGQPSASGTVLPITSTFHSIPSHPIPLHPIPSHPIPSHPIPSCFISSQPIPLRRWYQDAVFHTGAGMRGASHGGAALIIVWPRHCTCSLEF